MAQLLTIGCSYEPNAKVVNKDGTKTFDNFVTFYFNCDARTANIIAGSGVIKGLKVDGDSLVKRVKADKYKEFIYGKLVFPKIIGELEKYGYSFDESKLDELDKSVEQTINNYAQSGVQKKLNNDVADFINKLIEAMEKNMSDPNFMAFLDSVGKIKRFIGNDNIDKLTELTTDNKIMILTQWLSSGHQGNPTYVATKKQFKEGGYNVNPGATPLYFVHPTDVIGRTIRKTLADIGMNRADYDADDLAKLQVCRLSNDKDYGNNNASHFIVSEPYYDISECTPFRQSNLMDKILSRDSANNINQNVDKDTLAQQKKEVIANIELQNKDILSDDVMCKNAREYGEKIGDKKLVNIASRGIAADVVKFLANNAETYLRKKAQRDAYSNYSSENRELLEAIALKKLGLGSADVDRVIASNCSSLRYNGGVNKKAFITIASDLENIYYIMAKGINESVSNDMLMFVLDSCGISVEEFKNMPNDEFEAQNTLNGVRENFIRAFNNLLIAGRR